MPANPISVFKDAVTWAPLVRRIEWLHLWNVQPLSKGSACVDCLNSYTNPLRQALHHHPRFTVKETKAQRRVGRTGTTWQEGGHQAAECVLLTTLLLTRAGAADPTLST